MVGLIGVKNKRGISEVVATVLIILLVIAGIAIIWGVIIPIVKNNLVDTDYSDVNLQIVTSEGYTVYDEELDLMMVQVKRGVDDNKLKGIFFKFVDENGNSVTDNTRSAPEVNQMKVYRFNLNDFVGKPVEISVAYVQEDGKVGEVTSTISLLPKGSLRDDMEDMDGDGIADNYGIPYPEVAEPVYEISLYSSLWFADGYVDSMDRIVGYEIQGMWARFEGEGPCVIDEDVCMEISSDPSAPCWNKFPCFQLTSSLGIALSGSFVPGACGGYDCLKCGSDEKAIVYETKEDCLSSLDKN